MTALMIEELVKAIQLSTEKQMKTHGAVSFEKLISAALARAKELGWELTYKKVEK